MSSPMRNNAGQSLADDPTASSALQAMPMEGRSGLPATVVPLADKWQDV